MNPVIDERYLEYGLVKMFFINLENLLETRAALAKQFHLSPTETDQMPYWEYEIWLIYLNKMVQDENERNEAQLKKYKVEETMSRLQNPKSMQPRMPQMPSFGSMKTPSFPK